MPRKTIALIVTLFIITVVLLFVAMRSNAPKTQLPPQPITTEQPTLSPFVATTLSLSPNPVYLTASKGTADVEINTNTNEVTAVQLEIKYDPKVLTNVKVVQGPFFTQAIQLLNVSDTKGGHVTYAIGITPSQNPLQGTGIVAKITFNKIPSATAQETQITIEPNSLVTSSGIDTSVLKSTNSTSVILQ